MNQPETYSKRVETQGHRRFVGGISPHHWHHIGKMQYHYLISQGLSSNHKFLDVACGSLRLGQWLIPMLDRGNYYGIDGNRKLVECGLKEEILFNVTSIKKPNFSYNYNFDFRFIQSFDYAIAQSLFTHLTLYDISRCFYSIEQKMHPESKFYCTFFEGEDPQHHTTESDPNLWWSYTFETLQKEAQKYNLQIEYIGDWGHPAGQKLLLAHK